MVKQSGQAINVSLENQLTFNTQRKTFSGIESREENLMKILPLVQLWSIIQKHHLPKKLRTDEAVNNTMAGFNLMYNNQSTVSNLDYR